MSTRVVQIGEEDELPAVRRPGSGAADVSANRTLSVRERDDFLHTFSEVHEPNVVVEADARGKRNAPPVRPPSKVCHDVVDIRQLFRSATGAVSDENVVPVSVAVRDESDPASV